MKKSALLELLFERYDISNLSHGIKEDKLGDLMEEYCVTLLNSSELLIKSKANLLNFEIIDDCIFSLIVQKSGIDISQVESITATNNIPHRTTGGNPKTDVLATFHLVDSSSIELPISVKQTTAAKVAMAEFDTKTIFDEVGITDSEVKRLMNKHQSDASAKNFTKEEKTTLSQRLKPFARSLVRWVLTGSPVPSNAISYPKIIVKVRMSKNDVILNVNVYDVEEYVNSVMLDKKGKIRTGGFGTGLGWTYATGSKGKKIQFKG